MSVPTDDRSAYHVQLLGELCVRQEDRVVARFPTRKAATLLAYLALHLHRTHSREHLMDLLWPESDPESARQSLRQALSMLRRLLEKTPARQPASRVSATRDKPVATLPDEPVSGPRVPLLMADRLNVRLNPALVRTDVMEFEAAIKAAQDTASAAERARWLALALESYQGELLPAVYDEWVLTERERLQVAYVGALRAHTQTLLALGDLEGAERSAAAWAAADPGNEAAHRALMERMAARGDRAAALRHYEALERTLRQEFEVEPEAQTLRLVARLRTEPGAGSASDLDTQAPAGLNTGGPAHNLPHALTSFVGREQELQNIGRLLSDHRLVSLVGAGGSGKTRLAREALLGVAPQYPQGVWLIDLAPLTDPDLVSRQLAGVLQVTEGTAPLLDVLAHALRPQRLVLLVDNCEHLVDGCARLLLPLLQSCPELRVLATSREPLGIDGEVICQVASLPVPEPDWDASAILEEDAVRLLLDRIQTARPEFGTGAEQAATLARIARRLDGMPLALELAASQARAMSLEQMASRLDDRFALLMHGNRTALPRHQTLRATIDWSYDLLNEQERTLLRRLSVFAGGWTLEAVESVCEGEGMQAFRPSGVQNLNARTPEYRNTLPVQPLLTSLVDKSLVVFEEGRYRLLETVRQYAREKLLESGDGESLRDRHLAYFLAFAEETEARCKGPEQPEWLDRLEAEHDNVRTALARAREAPDRIAFVQLTGALGHFWKLRDHTSEGVEWLEQALSADASGSPRVRARVLEWRALLGAPDAARLREEAVVLYRQAGDLGGTARCLAHLAHQVHKDPARALALSQEAIALARTQPDRLALAETLYEAGWAQVYIAGRREPGGPDYRHEAWSHGVAIMKEALAVAQETGNPFRIAEIWDGLAWVHVYRGPGHHNVADEPAQARACLQQALTHARVAGARSYVLYVLGRLSRFPPKMEDDSTLIERLKEGIELIHGLQDKREAGRYLAELVRALAGREGLKAAKPWIEAVAAMRPDPGLVPAIGDAQTALARIATAQGDLEAEGRPDA